VQLESSSPLRDSAPDPAEPDDAERRTADLVALQGLVGPAGPPATRSDKPVADDDSPPHGEDQAKCEVGGRGRRDPGSVRHGDAAVAAGLHVHEVVAGSVVGDDAKTREPLERRLVDRLRHHRQRLDVLSRRLKIPVLDVRELVPRGPWESA
jgi:hypothetical protein